MGVEDNALTCNDSQSTETCNKNSKKNSKTWKVVVWFSPVNYKAFNNLGKEKHTLDEEGNTCLIEKSILVCEWENVENGLGDCNSDKRIFVDCSDASGKELYYACSMNEEVEDFSQKYGSANTYVPMLKNEFEDLKLIDYLVFAMRRLKDFLYWFNKKEPDNHETGNVELYICATHPIECFLFAFQKVLGFTVDKEYLYKGFMEKVEKNMELMHTKEWMEEYKWKVELKYLGVHQIFVQEAQILTEKGKKDKRIKELEKLREALEGVTLKCEMYDTINNKQELTELQNEWKKNGGELVRETFIYQNKIHNPNAQLAFGDYDTVIHEFDYPALRDYNKNDLLTYHGVNKLIEEEKKVDLEKNRENIEKLIAEKQDEIEQKKQEKIDKINEIEELRDKLLKRLYGDDEGESFDDSEGEFFVERYFQDHKYDKPRDDKPGGRCLFQDTENPDDSGCSDIIENGAEFLRESFLIEYEGKMLDDDQLKEKEDEIEKEYLDLQKELLDLEDAKTRIDEYYKDLRKYKILTYIQYGLLGVSVVVAIFAPPVGGFIAAGVIAGLDAGIEIYKWAAIDRSMENWKSHTFTILLDVLFVALAPFYRFYIGKAAATGLQETAKALEAEAQGLRGEAQGLREGAKVLSGQAQGLRGQAQGLRGQAQGLRGQAQGLRGEAEVLSGEAQGLRGEAQELREEAKILNEGAVTSGDRAVLLSRQEGLGLESGLTYDDLMKLWEIEIESNTLEAKTLLITERASANPKLAKIPGLTNQEIARVYVSELNEDLKFSKAFTETTRLNAAEKAGLNVGKETDALHQGLNAVDNKILATQKNLEASVKDLEATIKDGQASVKDLEASVKDLEATTKERQALLNDFEATTKEGQASVKDLEASAKEGQASAIETSDRLKELKTQTKKWINYFDTPFERNNGLLKDNYFYNFNHPNSFFGLLPVNKRISTIWEKILGNGPYFDFKDALNYINKAYLPKHTNLVTTTYLVINNAGNLAKPSWAIYNGYAFVRYDVLNPKYYYIDPQLLGIEDPRLLDTYTSEDDN